MSKSLLAIWSSFWVAALTEVLFFVVIDPKTLFLFGQPVSFSPLATYTIGFFFFWLVCLASSLSMLFFMRDGNKRWGRASTSGRP